MKSTAQVVKLRKQIKKRLKSNLKRLHDTCLILPEQPFPSYEQLDEIYQDVRELAGAMGIRRLDRVHIVGMIKALDKAFPTLKLKSKIEKLLAKIEASELGPLARVIKQLSKSNMVQADMVVKALLKGDFDDPQPDWSHVYQALQPFTSRRFQEVVGRNRWEFDFDYQNRLQQLTPVLGHFAFLDVRTQCLEWKIRHKNNRDAAIWWIYHLMNPDWNKRLESHLAVWTKPPRVDDFKALHKKALQNTRARRSYHKRRIQK